MNTTLKVVGGVLLGAAIGAGIGAANGKNGIDTVRESIKL